jgi:exopolysaccharide production protein ExoY
LRQDTGPARVKQRIARIEAGDDFHIEQRNSTNSLGATEFESQQLPAMILRGNPMSILDSSQRLEDEALGSKTSRSRANAENGHELTIVVKRRSSLRIVSSAAARFVPGTAAARLADLGTVVELRGKPAQGPVGGAWKRALDITVALCALVVLAPIMAVVALLILVTMGRPVVFIQQRVGFGRAMFGCFKFRTMVPDAQERLARYLAENPEAAVLWRETQKLRHDPRITWLGHVLRKTSLDELPQLFNVLRGEMSCVGPRPVIANELARYGTHAADYLSAKPGLTGMWQVGGRSTTSYAHRVNCDRYYVRRWSLMLDVIIMLRTVPAVMRFRDSC